MKAERIPDIWLERYLLDELPSPETEQVSRALILDKTLAARLEELSASGDELLLQRAPGQRDKEIAEFRAPDTLQQHESGRAPAHWRGRETYLREWRLSQDSWPPEP